ncbi:hypothetical protein U473_14110 [Tepidibacillus decaturensis]|uniref:Uncharacterized protein n=1 Tax=Tepidibacillus decaturensis TaxID=1413211 RepID=A0A135L0M7_9BACI|nr:hypothetical protein U473_14110 [Tepidibacillus decaturensis]
MEEAPALYSVIFYRIFGLLMGQWCRQAFLRKFLSLLAGNFCVLLFKPATHDSSLNFLTAGCAFHLEGGVAP